MIIGPESQLGGQVVSDIANATKNIYPIFQRNKYNRCMHKYSPAQVIFILFNKIDIYILSNKINS